MCTCRLIGLPLDLLGSLEEDKLLGENSIKREERCKHGQDGCRDFEVDFIGRGEQFDARSNWGNAGR